MLKRCVALRHLLWLVILSNYAFLVLALHNYKEFRQKTAAVGQVDIWQQLLKLLLLVKAEAHLKFNFGNGKLSK